MEKIRAKKIYYLGLVLASAVLYFSAIMDWVLWEVTGYLVPSWAISALVFGCTNLLIVLGVVLQKFEDVRKKHEKS